MKEKLTKPLSEIRDHPETYRRVWTVELQGKLIEGLWLIVPMSLSTNFFLHYQNGEVWLTDNLEDQK